MSQAQTNQPQQVLPHLIIQVNPDGAKAVEALCDVALKTAGLSNYAHVTRVLASLKLIPPQVPTPKNDAEETQVPPAEDQ